jgi:hypothetical protein
MTTTSSGRTYPLVYLVYNTFFNVLTQDGQVAIFENAARHLDDDGVVLVEAAVPSAWPGLAVVAGPDGPDRRAAAAGPLGWMEARALHGRGDAHIPFTAGDLSKGLGRR